MSATDRVRHELERQQATGTHNPATPCECGTIRTPGITHAKGNTGPDPQYLLGGLCSK